MKHILIIWFIIGNFAVLLFVFETWRYAREKISKEIGFLEHLQIVYKHMVWWLPVVLIIIGPIGIWFSVRGLEAAKKETKNLFDD